MKTKEREQLEKEATHLLDFVRSLDPSWNERAKITMQEKGYTPLQVIGAWIGHVLDAGQHMLAARHPFFEQGFRASGAESQCPVCGQTFRVAFPGQQACNDACWREWPKVKERPFEELAAAHVEIPDER